MAAAASWEVVFLQLWTQYIYQYSKLLVPVVYFAEPIKTNLLDIWRSKKSRTDWDLRLDPGLTYAFLLKRFKDCEKWKQKYLCVGYFDEQTSFHFHHGLKCLRLFGGPAPILDPPWPWIQLPAHGLCQLNQNQVGCPIVHTNTVQLHWCMCDGLEIFSFLPNHRVFWLEKFLLHHLQRLQ